LLNLFSSLQAVPNAKGESGKDKGNKVGDEELNHVNSSNGGGSFERRGRGRGRGGSTTDRGKDWILLEMGSNPSRDGNFVIKLFRSW
jgi:hypothetical protein